MGGRGDRPGRARTVAEFLIGTLVVLLARSRRMPVARGWRSGAVEIQLPFATGRYRLRASDDALEHRGPGPARVMRPLLFAGFLLTFAGIGVGFGGFDVAPPTALAPGTPGPQVEIVHIADESTEISDAAGPAREMPVLARALPTETATATATATHTPEPTPTATEEPPTATPTQEPATPEPTPIPATAVPEPEPVYNYYPVAQLTDAEFRQAASQAGWPEALHAQLVAVAWCESSFRPNVYNAWAYGLMQLVPSWFDYAGEDFTNWTDPVVNLRVAYSVYQYDVARGNEPWAQWVCKPPANTAAPPATATPTATSTVLAAATDDSTEQ